MQSQTAKILPWGAGARAHRRQQPATADILPFKPLQALEQTPREWRQHPLNPLLCWAGIFCVSGAMWFAAFRLAGLL